MTKLNPVIHESGRLVLVSSLYVVEEADFVYLANRTEFSSGKISSHMAKLEAAGYVDIAKEFIGKRPRTTYKLTDTGRHAFEQYRASIDVLLNADE
jgi:DNA-binding PadR family transcriptional regulator